jgi:hypothetical protein
VGFSERGGWVGGEEFLRLMTDQSRRAREFERRLQWQRLRRLVDEIDGVVEPASLDLTGDLVLADGADLAVPGQACGCARLAEVIPITPTVAPAAPAQRCCG